MNPGDMVRGRSMFDDKPDLKIEMRPVSGILLRRFKPTQTRHVTGWWEVLCENGIVVKEHESCMEVVNAIG